MKNFTSLNNLLDASSWLPKKALILGVGLLFGGHDMLAQKTPPSPGVGGTQAGFEIDSDFKSGFIPGWWNSLNYTPPGLTVGDDWSKGPTGNAVLKQENNLSVPGVSADGRSRWQVDGNYGNASAVTEMSTFSGNSNKNGDAIGSGQSPYNVQIGGSGPQKNDITNTFLHAREDNNSNTWLFFGAETRSVDGASYLDFEYNQKGVELIGGKFVGQGLVNGRTVGDFLLVINYTGGGNKPVVGVRKWLASGTWSAELPVGNLGAFVTTNTGNIDPVAPNKAFGGDGAYSNTTAALQFVEGGLNVTALNLGLNLCTPEATVTVKTRSSPSYTSELKDFDILNFSLTPAALAAVATVSPVCKAASGSTVFQVSGTYSNGTPTWSVTAGGVLSNQVYANGVATATVSIAGNGPETVTLTTASSNGACPSATASRTCTILANPNVSADNKEVCPGFTVPLTGSPAGGTWSGTGVTGSTFSSVGLTSGQYTVTYSVTDNSTCNNSATATVTIKDKPAMPNVTVTEVSLCPTSLSAPKITINCPVVGLYSLTQTGVQGTRTFNYTGSNGPVEFTNMVIGAGYSVKVTVNGCDSDPATCSVNGSCTLRIAAPNKPQQQVINNEGADEKSIKAFPVPFSDKVTVEFKSKKAESYVVNLYDMQGKLVKQLAAGNANAGEITRLEVDGKGMIESMYLVRKVSKSGIETVKILKKE